MNIISRIANSFTSVFDFGSLVAMTLTVASITIVSDSVSPVDGATGLVIGIVGIWATKVVVRFFTPAIVRFIQK